ncbi:hypothetical protein ON010_g6626 [Phytophthora cinnamomi]|nr:hypothetical protein ON010_g6626 [Phytophthora cinnamomi]
MPPASSECSSSSSSSDAETVLGEEDSPLSPCLWTQPAAAREADTQQETTQETAPSSSSGAQSSAPLAEPRSASHAPRRRLLLSPASQLDVLSQISELADAQAARQSVPAKPIQRRAHVWALAPGAATGKRNSRPAAASDKSKAKRKKKAPMQPTRSQIERLAADMLGWDTCSGKTDVSLSRYLGGCLALALTVGAEEDLFLADEHDDWRYEDISDSDFEG